MHSTEPNSTAHNGKEQRRTEQHRIEQNRAAQNRTDRTAQQRRPFSKRAQTITEQRRTNRTIIEQIRIAPQPNVLKQQLTNEIHTESKGHNRRSQSTTNTEQQDSQHNITTQNNIEQKTTVQNISNTYCSMCSRSCTCFHSSAGQSVKLLTSRSGLRASLGVCCALLRNFERILIMQIPDEVGSGKRCAHTHQASTKNRSNLATGHQ